MDCRAPPVYELATWKGAGISIDFCRLDRLGSLKRSLLNDVKLDTATLIIAQMRDRRLVPRS